MKKGDGISRIILNKNGQVTLFLIIAVLIVAGIALAYLFFPQILTNFGIASNDPNIFIQSCMENKIQETITNVSLNGGSLEPENYILYNNQKVEYLCYNENYYLPCIMQQPLLKQHIENEIKRGIQDEAELCFDSLEESFDRRGYEVILNKGDTNVELLPEKVVITFENDLTLSKDSSQRYDGINIVLNNNIYELVTIANSILNWEARYGDAETTTYMNYYPELKVEKKKQSDGSTVYILTNRQTEDVFQFASRSVAWPSGYDI